MLDYAELKDRLEGCGLDIGGYIDVNFLYAGLGRIPPEHHERATLIYIKKWLGGMAEAEDSGMGEHQWQNEGRRSANTWLRLLLERKGLPKVTEEELQGKNINRRLRR